MRLSGPSQVPWRGKQNKASALGNLCSCAGRWQYKLEIVPGSKIKQHEGTQVMVQALVMLG